MESERTEASHGSPKWNKSTKLMKDSILRVPNLPAELITEILSRLPVKPVLRFRSVSKSWLYLTSSTDFVRTHLNISANNEDYTHHRLMMIFLRREPCFLMDCSLQSLLFDETIGPVCPLESPIEYFQVVGSINGLICLSNGNDVFIWNPSIRKFKKLPGFIPPISDNNIIARGFGYDEVLDDYKVVIVLGVLSVPPQNHAEVVIYSLKSDSSRRIQYDLQDGVSFQGVAKFVNGKLHWATKLSSALEGREWDIISFDLVDEKWGKMEHPCYRRWPGTFRLGVLGSNLSLLCNYLYIHLDVWVMKEYGVKESWTKMCTINHPDDQRSPFSSMRLTPSYISHKGEILLVFGSSLVFYSKDNSVRSMKIANASSCLDNEIYVESLVCPLSQNQEHDKYDGSRSSDEQQV